MRNLIEQPLQPGAISKINKAAFYSRFNENLEKILNAGKSLSEIEIGAARDNISLCRAAIGGFAAKGELKNVHEIIDYYGPWSNLMIKTAQVKVPGEQQETKDISYNIIYLPDGEKDNIKRILKEITTSVSLVKNVKEKWQSFKETGDWGDGVVIGDGGMGTALIERGLEPTPVSWLNKTHRDEVLNIHEKHIKAGAQIVLTNTLDANRSALGKYREHKEEYVNAVKELNVTGVEIAHQARGRGDVLVLGRIGPSRYEVELFSSNGDGGNLEDGLRESFKEQARILCGEGVDGIWIEGMSYLDEAVIAVKAVKEHTNVPVICTMQFEFAGRLGKIDFKTLTWRNEVSDVIEKLQEAGVDMIGANCGKIAEMMPLLAHRMRKQSTLPLVFKVDAGYERIEKLPEMGVEGRAPGECAEIVSQVAAAGGSIVAGCCWAKAAHIAALRERLKTIV